MSDLYKEAILDAKKLRQVAEEDARNSIMEKVAPYIKKMIAKEAVEESSFFFEEDDETGLPPVPPAPVDAAAGAAPEGMPDAGMPQTLGDVPASASEAPISPSGEDMVNVPMPDADGKITIDFEQLFSGGGQGDIVPPVDTNAVAPGEAVPPAPEMAPPVDAAPPSAGDGLDAAPGSAPAASDMVGEPSAVGDASMEPDEEEGAPPAPVMEAVSYNRFKMGLHEAALKIDNAFFAEKLSTISEGALKNKLFSLLETLDALVEKGELSAKQARLNEKRLEFLFLKLKEAGLRNSYNTDKGTKKEDPMTKSLKEFAAKLFENEDQESLAMDSVSSGKTGLPVDGEMTDQAMEQSGVSPEVDDLFKEEHDAMSGGKTTDTSGAGRVGTVKSKALPNADGGKAQDKPWEEGEPETVSEEVEAKGHAGFGDSSEKPVAAPDMFFEIDENELKEAIASIQKENSAKKKAAGAKEKGWENGKPEGKKPAGVKKALNKESRAIKEYSMDGMDEMGSAGMGEDLVLNVDLPGELEDEFGADDFDVDLELSGDEGGFEGDVGGLGDEEEELEVDSLGDEEGGEADDMVSALSDEPSDEDDLEGSSEEEEMVLADEEGMDEMASMFESKMKKAKRAALSMRKQLMENRRAAVSFKKLAEARSVEVRQLKKEMAETNLFLSKLLYLNKFLQKEGLSRKVKQQIVEHLDRASTVAEAKAIYSKIKNKLDESTAPRSATTAGSASKATTAGSAKLNEGTGHAASKNGSSDSTVDPIVGTFARWQKLAKIGKTEE